MGPSLDSMLDAEELTCADAMRKRSLLSDDLRRPITEEVHTLMSSCMHYNFDTESHYFI